MISLIILISAIFFLLSASLNLSLVISLLSYFLIVDSFKKLERSGSISKLRRAMLEAMLDLGAVLLGMNSVGWMTRYSRIGKIALEMTWGISIWWCVSHDIIFCLSSDLIFDRMLLSSLRALNLFDSDIEVNRLKMFYYSLWPVVNIL